MLNSEKYKGAKERAEAFREYCRDHKRCEGCVMRETFENPFECSFYWLGLEAEAEEPLPCPFCGKELSNASIAYKPGMMDLYQGYSLHCIQCGYRSKYCTTRDAAIAAHNRVARAAKGIYNGESHN